MSNPFKTFEKQITEEKSEIKELKKAYDIVQDHLVRAEQKLRDKDKLITELCDALKKANPTDRYRNLLQRGDYQVSQEKRRP
jgi:hypothetical protein